MADKTATVKKRQLGPKGRGALMHDRWWLRPVHDDLALGVLGPRINSNEVRAKLIGGQQVRVEIISGRLFIEPVDSGYVQLVGTICGPPGRERVGLEIRVEKVR